MRYYDHKSSQCNTCAWIETGEFPDGTPYECCKCYGYIFHPEKGISDEPCPSRCNERPQPKKDEPKKKKR